MTATHETVEGVELLIEGEGPETMVMIHGWPDTWRLWDAQVEALKGRYRCVRFTLPGYDVAQPARPVALAQMVHIFQAIVDHVSPDHPVTLLMHDWGCIYGYQYLARYPERVARAISVDIGDAHSGAYIKSLPGKAKLGILGYQLWLALAWKLGGGLGNRMARYMARLLRCKTDPALIGSQMGYPYAAQWSGGFREAVNYQPHCPLLYIYGLRKPCMFHSPRWLEQVQATPGSAVRAFETGHWVMVQQPEAFNQCIGEWLEAVR